METQDAADWLARLAVSCQTDPLTSLEKTAAGFSDHLQAVGDWFNKNPAVREGLIGSGLGAGIGGLHTAFSNAGEPEEHKRSVLSSMLTGGVAGGALGAGGRLAYDNLRALNKPTEPAADAAAAEPEKLVKVTHNGVAYEMPMSQAAKLDAESQPTTRKTLGHWAGEAAGATKDVFPHVPWLAGVAGADAALNLPGIGINRISPEYLKGNRAAEFLMTGASKATGITDAVRSALSGSAGVIDGKTLSVPGGGHLGSTVPSAMTAGRVPSWVPGSGHRANDAMLSVAEPTPALKGDLFSKMTGGAAPAPKPVPPSTVTRELLQRLQREGMAATPGMEGRTLRQIPFSRMSWTAPGGWRGAILPRVLGYGGVLGGDYLLSGMAEDAASTARQSDILNTHVKQIPGSPAGAAK